MLRTGKRSVRSFGVLLWTAVLFLIILLIVALWSFFHGALSFTDAFGVAGFAAVMIGVLAWASFLSRNTADGDSKAARTRIKTR